MNEQTSTQSKCQCGKTIALGTDHKWRHVEMVFDCRSATPATQREEASRVHSINCIHCPHALQYHLSGVLEGTKRGCTQCDCPGFESQSIAPDSLEAEQRRKHPHYQLIQRLDDFLHELCGDQKYKQEADQLHGEIHEAAFWFVTQQEMSAEEHAQWRMLINQHLVAAREDRDHWKGIAEASRETQPCQHEYAQVREGNAGDEGYMVVCDGCGEDLTPGPSLPTEARVPEGDSKTLLRALQKIRTESTDSLGKYSKWGEIADKAICEFLGLDCESIVPPKAARASIQDGRESK